MRDDLSVAVQGQLLVEDRELQLVRVRRLVLPELHQDGEQQHGGVAVLQARLGPREQVDETLVDATHHEEV